ncbi:hypothetical protein IMPR6_310002 [Imperialibacter sp. EC-SDR9]|nr:hypothetical protein IMPERIA89_210067 [Imperialibacter sp. 89]CAD5256555.1 hypothetical protein IMPERIA75_210067 [Imperialibacter sp. 75]VVT20039.1 hypothetical protein IMPR6_310002 [Imperialibacter sp. EC-SDR9]
MVVGGGEGDYKSALQQLQCYTFKANVMPIVRNERGIPLGMADRRIEKLQTSWRLLRFAAK